MKLEGKTVLITGAAKRLGRALAEAFSDRGASVLVHYKTSKKEAASLVSTLRSRGIKSESYQADLANLKSIQRMIKKIRRDRHRIDLLINNAALFYPTPFGRVSEKDWDAFLDVNLKAPYFLAQSIAPFMRRGGRIINISDRSATHPCRDFLPYCISKAGLLTLTEGLAKLLAPKVLVSAVCPGPTLPSSPLERRSVKRWGSVEGFVKEVLFLAGDH
ncbi:MAG: SDR family NAD(P)-dependent oxidoreductase [Deltaproteobacteria bacterium]|nr:SDR family NAD(P)-dependent oxidoreductase [Deltaproteobacteria bacterium]